MAKTFTNKDENLILEIRTDPLSAWLTIKKTGKLIDENEILALIDEAGIKNGFDEAVEYLRLQSLEKEYDVPFPIAMCNKQECNIMLHYKFNPDLPLTAETPIDVATLAKLIPFRTGDVVAEYSCNIFNQSGSIYDIFGELIDFGLVDIEQAKALAGDNITYDNQNRHFIALKDGFPYLDEQGRICLLNSITLSSKDIPAEAKIQCPIDLLLDGTIAFADIECEADLYVQGDLHSCTVVCKKDLEVKGEIISCIKKGIIIGGNLECQSISGSNVLCQNDIHFTDKIESSTVVCDGEIVGAEGSSEICGGLTQAGNSITVFQAGTYDRTKTEIEIALCPFYRNLLLLLTRELVHLKEEREINATAIAALENRIQNYETALDENLNRILKTEQPITKKIKVQDLCRPPIIFRILKHSYEVSKPQKGLTFEEKD